ncbi:uncharacterized protein LOC122028785 [Zingiber officinale]|uniref:DUF7804 domain-containing protein n=1 Tax=Zingiber officinale TaxID=94328 RepID=A0A8J5C3H7_ZINOF|nr:uncharacterized protein LOC122028785 [Zingiber officinale]KAG6471733.1 hypothetical protein ZIOFF_069179 [Zingiber officinale]
MTSSSCGFDLRSVATARELPLLMEKRGGPSLCCRLGARLTSRRRRRMCAEASLTISRSTVATADRLSSERRDLSVSTRPPPLYFNKAVEEERARATPEKLEQWIMDSIGEIVRNIENEPFLMHIFSDCGGASGLRLVKEEAFPERWPRIKKRWERTRSAPDAVILVERLEGDGEDEEDSAIGAGGCDSHETWALVVQGRGMDCAACYILNTTRVMSAVGFCTHFCLVRAQCFGDPVHVQLMNAWLQR